MIESYQQYRPVLSQGVYQHHSSVIIGQVHLDQQSSVWANVTIRADIHQVVIGARSNIQDNVVIHVTRSAPTHPGGFDVKIGRDVSIGHGAIIHGAHIGDRCLIGMGAIILDGAVIESDCLIAAGALVPPGKHLKSGACYKGHPISSERPLSDVEKTMILQNATDYVALAKSHQASTKSEVDDD